MNCFWAFCLFLPTYLCGAVGDDGMMNMKIVDEPTNYGANLLGYQQQGRQANRQSIQAYSSPSNCSGPTQLKRLFGKCFKKVIGSYRYEFCPFANVTQHEEVMRWNAYSGVLGVWQEWFIENNTFVSMLMTRGDLCGSRRRSTEVTFVCGNQTVIRDVTEPRTCEYMVELSTPLVCHPDSMLVYPTLSEELRDEWDLLEGMRQQDYITDQGYNSRLHELLVKAGYQLNATQRESLHLAKSADTETRPPRETGSFDSLIECQTEFTRLKHQFERLQALLTKHGINSTDTSSPSTPQNTTVS